MQGRFAEPVRSTLVVGSDARCERFAAALRSRGIEVVFEPLGPETVAARLAELQPSVLVVTLDGDRSGQALDLILAARGASPALTVIAVTSELDPDTVCGDATVDIGAYVRVAPSV